jgi:hypothetical protein
MRQLLDREEYYANFCDPIYNEIYVDWYSPTIYNIYFNDNYVNNDNIKMTTMTVMMSLIVSSLIS